MSNPLQNFYNSQITNDWSIGTGNFYVSVKPTTSVGRLVVSPSSDTLREIIEYTSTGTDGNGDYITISVRGVGDTTEQTHTVGEKVRMNITAEDWADMRDDIDSIVAAGAPNASTVTKGLVEIATDAEVIAETDTGETGAKLVATPGQITLVAAKQADVQVFTTEATLYGATNSQFDITNTSGTTYRYTWDGNGTSPGITALTFPVGAIVGIKIENATAVNNGVFIITGSGTNYFEVTNPSGIAENDKTINSTYGLSVSTLTWTKPTGAKVVEVIAIGAGGGGGGGASKQNNGHQTGGGTGGGGGAITTKIFEGTNIPSTAKILVGKGGAGGISTQSSYGNYGNNGTVSSFGALLNAFGGGGGYPTYSTAASGGSGGGSIGGGTLGTTSPGVVGGTPGITADAVGFANQGSGGLTTGKCAEYGGACGGGSSGDSSVGYAGGSSMFGGAGGGGGGGLNGATPGATSAGMPGGRSGVYFAGGGGTLGADGGGAGGAGTSRTGTGMCGDGGGGGGSKNTGTAGAGGAGGLPGAGGGGGGGNALNCTGGNGGLGGRGEVIVITYF